MMTAFRTIAALLTAGVLLRGAAACAAPVLGNLAQPAQDRAVAVSLNEWQASSFRLSESAGAWRVRSITVRMAQQTANESFAFRITGETALRPALTDVRAAFTTPAISGTGTQSITFTVKDSPAPVLQPGETYWLVAGVERQDGNFTPSTGLSYWSYALNSLTDTAPAAGWSFGPATATAGTAGAGWAPDTTTPFTFSIDAVPENSAMTLARWRELNPGGPADNAAWLSADPDQNGLNGLMDFAFDRNLANLPVPVTDAAGRPGLEYTRWISAPELSWQFQSSADLQSWQLATAAETTITPAGPFSQRVRVVLPPQSGRRFLRILVSRP